MGYVHAWHTTTILFSLVYLVYFSISIEYRIFNATDYFLLRNLYRPRQDQAKYWYRFIIITNLAEDSNILLRPTGNSLLNALLGWVDDTLQTHPRCVHG